MQKHDIIQNQVYKCIKKHTINEPIHQKAKYSITLHSKKCWVVLTQFWVKYGQTQPLSYIFKLHF